MQICYINGSFENKSDALISVEDRGFNFSDGVYEVMSFSEEVLINFKKHLDRLKRSLKELRIRSPFKNFKSLELIIKKLIQLNKVHSGYIYLQITRGTAPRNHLFPRSISPNLVIFTFSIKKDDNLIKKGVGIGLTKDKRWQRCDIKAISLLPNLLEKQNAFENGFYEIWQIRNNHITEGSTSNAFIINSRDEIQTHSKNNLILGGVARDSTLEIAKKKKIKVIEKPFTVSNLENCKEAFLTSTTVGILPVVEVENKKINSGKPGLITKMLIKGYNDYIYSQINE